MNRGVSLQLIDALAPKFSSTLILVGKEALLRHIPPMETLKRSKAYAGKPWTVQNRVSLKPYGYTDEASNCMILGLQNRQQLTLAHLNPLEVLSQEEAALERPLAEDIGKLQQKGPVRGFITGGVFFSPLDNISQNSLYLFQSILTILKEKNLKNLSIFWGRSNLANHGPTHAFYSAPEDTWYICAERNKKTPVLTWKDVQDTFKMVTIAPGDRLITSDRTIEGQDSTDTVYLGKQKLYSSSPSYVLNA